jgi:predicted porin
MKLRSLHSAIGIAAMLVAGTAAAQSSVTIFGVADVAVRHANTERASGVTSVVSGSYSSARYGFRGVEDLGGGLSAAFWLESFLNMDAGTATPAGFQRRSTVSLIHRDFGELRLGRDYTPTHSNWSRFDPFGYVGVGSNQLLILSATGTTPVTSAFGTGNPNTVQRVSNGVQYLLPRNAWGLEGGLTYAFREGGTTANDQHRSVGGRLGVNLGKFFIGASSLRTSNTTAIGTFDDMGLGASYDAGFLRVTLAGRRFEYQNSAQNTYTLSGVVPFGPHEIKASFVRADMQGRVGATNIDSDGANQFALGYVYNFSKSFRFYATAATIRNKGNSRFVVPGAPPASAASLNSRGFEAGLNKEF